MIIVMNTEFIATLLGIFATGAALGVTIYLTNKSTQKLLEKLTKISERMDCSIDKLSKISEKVDCSISKTMFIGKCQLALQGYEVKENVTAEEARKLGELLSCDPNLRICAYKKGKPAL